MRKITALLFALAAGCGGAESEVQEPAVSTEPAPAAEESAEAATTMLGIGEMTISFDGKEGMRMKADGSLEANMGAEWKAIGSIANDAWTKDGKVGIRVQADGTIEFTEGDAKDIKFVGATLVAGDKSLSVSDDGTVSGVNPGHSVTIQGATTDAQKRTALLLVAGMMMVGKAESSEAQPAN